MLPEENYAQYQFINGDTGKAQDEKKVISTTVLDYDNPYIVTLLLTLELKSFVLPCHVL